MILMGIDAVSWWQALLSGTLPALVVGAVGFGGVWWTIRSQNKNLRDTFERQEEQLRVQLARQESDRLVERVMTALESLDDSVTVALQTVSGVGQGSERQRLAASLVLAQGARAARYAHMLGQTFSDRAFEAMGEIEAAVHALQTLDGETRPAAEMLNDPLTALGMLATMWLVNRRIPEDWTSIAVMLVDKSRVMQEAQSKLLTRQPTAGAPVHQ